MIRQELLDILACPKCKQRLDLRQAAPDEKADSWLVCSACGLRYPVREDIPIMLIEEAEPVAGTREGGRGS